MNNSLSTGINLVHDFLTELNLYTVLALGTVINVFLVDLLKILFSSILFSFLLLLFLNPLNPENVDITGLDRYLDVFVGFWHFFFRK